MGGAVGGERGGRGGDGKRRRVEEGGGGGIKCSGFDLVTILAAVILTG